MGKFELNQQDLNQNVNNQNSNSSSSSTILCESCSRGFTRLANEFNFKCVFVLFLSFSIFLSAIFWILPLHSVKYEFDATDAVKLTASVQAYFRLQKPVSLLVPHIERLEYDILGEVGVPHTKVAILSMHEYGTTNYTDVVFGVLSDQVNIPIDLVPLSVLRSSLVELFLQQSNLTLTTTIFGQPDLFEILMCTGGVTVVPSRSASIWQIPQVLFNFTLNNCISEIQNNFAVFKEQLKFGLHLRSYENVYVQITNKNGSTINAPVTVQASVMSDLGGLLPKRLKQLAQTITGSPLSKNLGLDHTVFGKVKGISLSSYLNGTLHTPSPTPAPAPSPKPKEYSGPTSPYHVPSSYPNHPLAPSPHSDVRKPPHCMKCYASPPLDDNNPHVPSPKSEEPILSLPPVNAPTHSKVISHPPRPAPHHGGSIKSWGSSPSPHVHRVAPSVNPPRSATPCLSSRGPRSRLSPKLSPLPMVSYGSTPGPKKHSSKGMVSPSLAPSPFVISQESSAIAHPYKEIWTFILLAFWILHLHC